MTEDKASKQVSGKEPEVDDPMELVVNWVPGDPEVMARCIIEEYAQMGMTEEQIVELFRQPSVQINSLYRARGEAWLRRLINDVLREAMCLRVSVKHFYHIGGGDDV